MNRRQIISSHNPILTEPTPDSPFTVGSGSFAFTADITGLQTLYDEYTIPPLCAMAEWAWHESLNTAGNYEYTYADLKQNVYDFCGRKVYYPRTKFKGNEGVYEHLRRNPHKFNLLRLSFKYKGEKITSAMLSETKQCLDLYSAVIKSSFSLAKEPVSVTTLSSHSSDTLAVKVISPFLKKGLSLSLDFPYPDCGITGSDWAAKDKHETALKPLSEGLYAIERKADRANYFVNIKASGCSLKQTSSHGITISPEEETVILTLTLSKEKSSLFPSYEEAESSSLAFWESFWEKGAFISAEGSQRAKELERRIILSQYLSALNSLGSMPPQETGLICNSWYGKPHLEMHFIHSVWTALWGRAELLEKSINWYKEILPAARENAARNGYKGARWTKMVSPAGKDCPSKISPFIIWQQPHIIEMLELIRKEKALTSEKAALDFVRDNYILVKKTADFIADYVVYDEKTDTYNIEPPVIPVQERFNPEDVKNPSFELAYFKHSLKIALSWAKLLNKAEPKWQEVSEKIALPPVSGGLYQAHQNITDTFKEKATDHPSMLMSLGYLNGEDTDKDVMKSSLKKVLRVWDLPSLWGWDFAVIFMTAARLGLYDTAFDCILAEEPKNRYTKNGNNAQIGRTDLPLYLPGNGSLLLAMAVLINILKAPSGEKTFSDITLKWENFDIILD
ncbi:MAG: glycoside hydrolase family 65 [Clostridiales bacterium]|nr:glycoside hydrolase family 65 [Clostridiales bacterium]